MDCFNDDWIINDVDDRGLLDDGFDDGLTSDDDDRELIWDIDCLDGGEIDGGVDDHGLLEGMDWLIDGHGLVSVLWPVRIELSWLLL